MVIDLSTQTVLVTGASRGIGAAIARRLAKAGARVAIHCGHNRQTAEALASEIGNGAWAFVQDLADATGCELLWNDVQRHFGRIDALVNNAGIIIESPLDVSTAQWADDWDRTMAVNLRAAGILSRAAIAHFRAHGGGRIVNVASRAAFRGEQPDYFAYGASKAGVVALTRSIARAFGKEGVTAFALAPGFTRTEMAQGYIDRYGPEIAMRDIALTRLTEPDDIAPMAVLLLSGLADHATGTTIDINAASYVR